MSKQCSGCHREVSDDLSEWCFHHDPTTTTIVLTGQNAVDASRVFAEGRCEDNMTRFNRRMDMIAASFDTDLDEAEAMRDEAARLLRRAERLAPMSESSRASFLASIGGS